MELKDYIEKINFKNYSFELSTSYTEKLQLTVELFPLLSKLTNDIVQNHLENTESIEKMVTFTTKLTCEFCEEYLSKESYKKDHELLNTLLQGYKHISTYTNFINPTNLGPDELKMKSIINNTDLSVMIETLKQYMEKFYSGENTNKKVVAVGNILILINVIILKHLYDGTPYHEDLESSIDDILSTLKDFLDNNKEHFAINELLLQVKQVEERITLLKSV